MQYAALKPCQNIICLRHTCKLQGIAGNAREYELAVVARPVLAHMDVRAVTILMLNCFSAGSVSAPFAAFVSAPFAALVSTPFAAFVGAPFVDLVTAPFAAFVVAPFANSATAPFASFVAALFAAFLVTSFDVFVVALFATSVAGPFATFVWALLVFFFYFQVLENGSHMCAALNLLSFSVLELSLRNYDCSLIWICSFNFC